MNPFIWTGMNESSVIYFDRDLRLPREAFGGPLFSGKPFQAPGIRLLHVLVAVRQASACSSQCLTVMPLLLCVLDLLLFSVYLLIWLGWRFFIS